MNESTHSKKIDPLPPGAKKQAQDFPDFLYQHYVSGKKKIKMNHHPFQTALFLEYGKIVKR